MFFVIMIFKFYFLTKKGMAKLAIPAYSVTFNECINSSFISK